MIFEQKPIEGCNEIFAPKCCFFHLFQNERKKKLLLAVDNDQSKNGPEGFFESGRFSRSDRN